MADYDPDRNYFRELAEREPASWSMPEGATFIQGSSPAWQCECFQWNGISVERCNNCGKSKELQK